MLQVPESQEGKTPFDLATEGSAPPRKKRTVLDTVFERAKTTSSEQAAEILKLRARSGVESDLIESNVEEARKLFGDPGFDSDTFKNSPRYGQWLQKDKNRIAVHRQDLQGFQKIEELFYRKDDPYRPLSDAETDEWARKAAERQFPKDAFDDVVQPGYPSSPKQSREIAYEYLLKQRRAEENFIAQSEKVGALETVQRKFEENPLFAIPYLADLSEGDKMLRLWDAVKGVEGGKPTETHLDDLKRYARLERAASQRGVNVGGKVADILSALPQVVGEFASTGTAYRSVRIGVEKALQSAMKTAITGTVRSLTRKAVGTMASAGAQAGIMSSVRFAPEVVSRMLPGVDLTADQKGQIAIALDPDEADGFGVAVLKTLGHEYIQALSERTGAGVEKLIGPLKASVASRWLKLNPKEGVKGLLARTKDAAGWNGMLGEVFEERVAEVGEGLLGIEKYTPPTLEQLSAEMISFAIPGAVGTSMEAYSSRQQEKRGKAIRNAVTLKELTETAKTLKSLDYAPEQAKEAVQAIVQGTDNEYQYLDARKFDEHFQGKKDENGKVIVPEDLAESIGINRATYRKAVESGEDFRVKTSEYIPTIAAGPYAEFFQDMLRPDPLDMSIAETRDLLTEKEREGAENVARAQLNPDEIIEAAKRVAVKEARATLEDMRRTDAISKVSEALGKRLNATNALVGDNLRRAAKLLGLSKAVLEAEVQKAVAERKRVEGAIESEDVPAYILDAVRDTEFQKTVAEQYRAIASRKEDEAASSVAGDIKAAKASDKKADAKAAAEAALEKSMAEREQKARQRASLRKITDQVTQALKAANFSREASPVAKFVVSAFKRIGERAKIDPADLFGNYNLSIEAIEDPIEALAAGELGQPNKNEQAPKRKRGRIRIGDASVSIHLPKEADRSTILHELGHLWLKILSDVAARPDASAEVKQDLQDILDWMGIKSAAEITAEHHELFAKANELYLMEGIPPSPKLRGVFHRFKEWLLATYEGVKEDYFAGVTLTPKVKAVFDRLLASESEIEDARNEEGLLPLFEDAKAAGWTDAKAEKYARLTLANRDKAAAALFKREMDELRKQDEEWWEEGLKEKAAAIGAKVDQQPVYRALSVLKTGKLPDGSSIPGVEGEIKLNRDAVRMAMPDETRTQPSDKIPAWTMSKNGVDLKTAAEWFGFPSATDLLSAIAEAEPRDALVERLAEEEMIAEHGALDTDEERARKAVALLHNEELLDVLQMEMEALAVQSSEQMKEMGEQVARVPRIQVFKDKAKDDIRRAKIRDIDPRIYQGVERRAQALAVKLYKKGDFRGALKAKTEQARNAAYFQAATEAKAFKEESLAKFRRLFKSDERLAKTRDLDVVLAARAVLARVNIGKSDKPASEYVAKIKNYDPDLYESLNAAIVDAGDGTREYLDLPFEEFERVVDAVNALWDLSLRTRQFEVEGKKIDMATAVDKIRTQLEKIKAPAAKKAYQHATTKLEKFKMNLLRARSALRMVESWADSVDMGDINGAAHTYIVRPIFDAADRYREAKRGYDKALGGLLDKIKADLTAEEIDAPELGYVFGRGLNGGGLAELLGALLHTGNESNLQKLLRGYKWGEFDEDGVLDSSRWDRFFSRMIREGKIRKEHMDFVQGVWDLLDGEKAGAQKAHHDMYGRYFEEITAKPIETPWGTYKGGYAPARVDPSKVADAEIRADREILERGDNSYAFPTTGRGSTMRRSEGYARQLDMNVGHLRSHLDWLARFIHLEPRVKDVARLINNKEMRAALNEFDPTVASEMLVPWLQRTAQQIVETPSKGVGKAMSTFWRGLRVRSGMLQMAGNLTNALQNVTGITLAATKVKWKYLLGSLWKYKGDPKGVAQSIQDASLFMRNTIDTEHAILLADMNEMLTNPNTYEKFKALANKHAYFLQKFTQGFLNNVVWQAAYDQAVEGGAEHEQAVREADSAVRLTQGTATPEGITRAEVGTAFYRLFVMFWRYFSMQGNLMGTEFAKTFRELGLKGGAGRAVYIYTMAFMIPAVVSEAIVEAMDGDDDDDSLLDYTKSFFGSQLRGALALIPGGNAIRTLFGAFTPENYDDRLSTSPAVTIIEKAAKAPASVYNAIIDKGKSSTAIKDGLQLVGLLTGLPTSILARPAGYLADVAEGEADPEGVLDFTRGVVTGKRGGY